MMSFHNTSEARRSAPRNRNLAAYSTSTKAVGPLSMSIILILITGILALLYLTQITKTTVYGYQVSDLSQQRTELVTRNQELEVEAARLQSVAQIQGSAVAKSLQPENQVSVVNSAGSAN